MLCGLAFFFGGRNLSSWGFLRPSSSCTIPQAWRLTPREHAQRAWLGVSLGSHCIKPCVWLLHGQYVCTLSAGRGQEHTSCVTGPDREAAIIWATALYGMKPLWPPIFISSWEGSSSCRHSTAECGWLALQAGRLHAKKCFADGQAGNTEPSRGRLEQGDCGADDWHLAGKPQASAADPARSVKCQTDA